MDELNFDNRCATSGSTPCCSLNSQHRDQSTVGDSIVRRRSAFFGFESIERQANSNSNSELAVPALRSGGVPAIARVEAAEDMNWIPEPPYDTSASSSFGFKLSFSLWMQSYLNQ